MSFHAIYDGGLLSNLFLSFVQNKDLYNMRYFLLIFISALFFSISVQAQETKEERKTRKKTERKARDKYLGAGIGFAKMSAKDKATSPLLYSGPTLLSNLDYLVHSDKLIKTVEFTAGVSEIRTNKDTHYGLTRSYAYGFYFNFRFTHNQKVLQFAKDKIKWYVGPGINITNFSRINYKFGNSLYNYEYMAGIGVSSRMEFPFSYKGKDFKFLRMKLHRRDRQLLLSWKLYVPVFTSIYRPNYVSILNFIDPETSIFNTNNLHSGIFTFLEIQSDIELFYFLHNGNILKLSYLWEYHQYKPGENEVQGAINGLNFSFVFKFNKSNQ
ncbi:MAG: hypothetical protein GXO89_07425 [Chlorobi bacterium]|nr:hypothetical protein [Chlorobiota bacterium]